MAATIPLSSFRVPDGMVAVTVDVNKHAPFTMAVQAENVEKLMQIVEQLRHLSRKDRDKPAVHVRFRNLIISMSAPVDGKRDEDLLHAAGCLAIWCALNHPEHADHLRKVVSASLRTDGKAHLTVAADTSGKWGFALADAFIDLDAALKLVPDDSDEPRSWAWEKKSTDKHVMN